MQRFTIGIRYRPFVPFAQTSSITLILYYSLVDYATTQQVDDTFCREELNEDEEIFMITGGYRPETHILSKYVVSVRNRFVKSVFGDGHLCGGSIISAKVILTAAQCMFISDTERQYYAKELSVVIGTADRLNRTSTTERLLVSHIKIHEKFSHDAIYWDIALMILYRNIKLNGWSAAIISLSVIPVDVNTVCTVLGWGRIYENGPQANHLVYADVAVLDNSTCMRLMPQFGEEQFCAADVDDFTKDACQSDAGGPLICDGIIHYSAMCDPVSPSWIPAYCALTNIGLGQSVPNPSPLPHSHVDLGRHIPGFGPLSFVTDGVWSEYF
uniref:Peptidase S1 domain-containing protein n=1 Tax=Glossina pallidipes TaxID=7398 RepID=A0A1B0AHU7_GLOPL